MKKRRVTLSLDADIVEALEPWGNGGLSAAAKAALRDAIEIEAHRAAMLRWLDELDAEHGRATPEEEAAIHDFLDAVEKG